MKRMALFLVGLLLTACASTAPRNAFDAIRLFSLGSNAVEPLPKAAPDEVVVRYGGWSLRELMQTEAGKRYMRFAEDRAKDEAWTTAKMPPGIYRWKKGEEVPVVLMATALLANRLQNGPINFDRTEDPFVAMADVTHCNEQRNPPDRVGLYWSEDALFIDAQYCSVQGGGRWEAKR